MRSFAFADALVGCVLALALLAGGIALGASRPPPGPPLHSQTVHLLFDPAPRIPDGFPLGVWIERDGKPGPLTSYYIKPGDRVWITAPSGDTLATFLVDEAVGRPST